MKNALWLKELQVEMAPIPNGPARHSSAPLAALPSAPVAKGLSHNPHSTEFCRRFHA